MSSGFDPMTRAGEAYAELMGRWAAALGEISGDEEFVRASERLLQTFAQQDALRARVVERWSEAMQELAGSEQYAAASGQVLALYAHQQEVMRAASRAVAEGMHLPTTDDLSEVARLVVNLERKIDAVADRLERLEGLDARTAAIGTAVEDLTSSVRALGSRVEAASESMQAAAASRTTAAPKEPAATSRTTAAPKDPAATARTTAATKGAGTRPRSRAAKPTTDPTTPPAGG